MRNPAPRQKLLKLDVTVLNDKRRSAEFCNKVIEKFDNSAGDSDYYTRVSNSMIFFFLFMRIDIRHE